MSKGYSQICIQKKLPEFIRGILQSGFEVEKGKTGWSGKGEQR